VVYGSKTPMTSKAEMESLEAGSNVELVKLLHGFQQVFNWFLATHHPAQGHMLSLLPGDIKYESPSGNFRFYFPITTSIVISIVLTLVLWLFS